TAIQAYGSGGANLSGHFGGNGVIGGHFNTIQVDVMTDITAPDGNNSYVQSLSANGVQVLQTAIQPYRPGGGVLLGGYGGGATMGGGYNTAQAGLFTSVNLAGGFDVFVERLHQAEVDLANAILAAAVSGGQALVDATAGAIGPHATLGNGDNV